MYEQKQLFDFMLGRIEDVGSEHGLKAPQAFGRWFASMFFDKPHDFSIPDGSGDGKVDLFFQTSNGKDVDHYILNTKFTHKYNAPAPVAFYDEINRFWQAFANKANRNEYLTSVVRQELRPKYKKLFEYYDNGNAQLFFVTNHRRNEGQYRTVKATDVQVFHLEEVLQFTMDYLEDAMPRTPSMMLTGINTVLSADKRDTEVPTSIVFAKLVDFIKYMEDDPYDLLFARNVRLSLGNTSVNKEIRTTFKDSPTEFVFSNNGITMLCERHTHDPGKQEIRIENPRIVNGSQTLHSIRDVGTPSLTARVMVRIIEVPPLSPDDFSAQAEKKREVIDKISIRSNRQNPIKPWNLVSTDDFQHDLARFFRKKRLYYERRDREWSYRRTELKSLGISRGPNIKWMAQLISSYNWDKKLLGPVPAKSELGLLFDGKQYELVKGIAPELAYQLYLLGMLLEDCSKQLAKSTKYVEHFAWQGQFTLFAMCVKALQAAGIEFGKAAATDFLEAATPTHKWLTLCKQGIDLMRAGYRKETKRRERAEQELTLTNYFKSQKSVGKILDASVSQVMRKTAKALLRAWPAVSGSKAKGLKNPIRVAASKKAWVTMRANPQRISNIHFGVIADTNYAKVLSNGMDTLLVLSPSGHIVDHLTVEEAEPHSSSENSPFAPRRHLLLAMWATRGRVALALNRHGEILVFKDRTLKFAFRSGTWSHFAHASMLQRMGGSPRLMRAVYASCLDVSFSRSGGCIAVAKHRSARLAANFLNQNDLLSPPRTDKTSLLNHLIGQQFSDIPRSIREEMIALDGATVLDATGTVIAAGAIVRVPGGSEGGGRLAAAKTLSRMGLAVKISADGGISAFSDGGTVTDPDVVFKVCV